MASKRTQVLGIVKLTVVAVAVASAMAFIPSSLAAESNLDDEIKLSLRYRLEHVEQDNPLQDALASTLRTRITALKAISTRWSAHAEVDYVEVLGGDTYNSTVNGRTHYSTVADPRGTDINQAFVQYRHEDYGTVVSGGRFRMNHLNQRFLGGVGWRQNEQTFDGLRLQQKIGSDMTLDVAAVHNVNRVFGPKGPQATQRGDLYTAVLSWTVADGHTLSAFTYDFDFRDWQAQNSRTVGMDYRTSLPIAEQAPLVLHAVFARQEDAHANPNEYRHHYHRLSAAWKYQNLGLELGQERLAGNGTTAFQTPLATLHAFQGFTDLFLVTPVDGVRDHFVKFSHPAGKTQLSVGYHYFKADHNSRKYGEEWNLTASRNFAYGIGAQFKLADFRALNRTQNFAVDTTKAWLMLTYNL
ncbi:alginate export family protein [Aliidiomarina haloalkalitolerans]|uniref:Alginate export domain-containing protein n=1 Tax=Aliidiomarina haloalkalitolerans TaxID=859059 RepID=A0A432VVW0_9GAMM|nr:alginate export family protein [Aliidiomarina haloalkalitolerans]RUO20727.1 hypothetical protein CWE06_05335 [Aliidiomarina haloalkalitolerans]